MKTIVLAVFAAFTAAVVGALVGAVIIIAKRSITDLPTTFIAIATIIALLFIKKIQEPYIIVIAAIIGICIKSLSTLN